MARQVPGALLQTLVAQLSRCESNQELPMTVTVLSPSMWGG